MKVKGKFEKRELRVGLSADVPMTYRGPEEKYALADLITSRSPTEIRYEKHVFEFELETTSDELVQTPERVRCYRLISAMPDYALREVEHELVETYKHYVVLDAMQSVPLLGKPDREMKATVVEQVKT